jgi:tetratricopeptide (TPR) repeat protein
MREICLIVRSFKLFVVASFLIIFQISENSHAFAQSNALDGLFEQLQELEPKNIERIERNIWREWRRSGSDAVDFLLEHGMESMSVGDFKTAVDHFTAAIDHAPDFAEAWNMRATAYFNLERYGPSVSDIEETLRLNPRHFGALGGFAMILENTHRPKQAMEVYKKVLKVHPHNESAKQAVTRLSEQLQGTAL